MKLKLERIIIAAISKNGIIGGNNKIPWTSKEELKHFKETTINNPVIMGRRTFESLGKPLTNRLNIIISSSPKDQNDKKDLKYYTCLHSAYEFLRNQKYSKVYICGGARVYRNSIKHAEKMILSQMNFNSNGDAKFPKINSKIWKVVKQEKHTDFTIKYYERKKTS